MHTGKKIKSMLPRNNNKIEERLKMNPNLVTHRTQVRGIRAFVEDRMAFRKSKTTFQFFDTGRLSHLFHASNFQITHSENEVTGKLCARVACNPGKPFTITVNEGSIGMRFCAVAFRVKDGRETLLTAG